MKKVCKYNDKITVRQRFSLLKKTICTILAFSAILEDQESSRGGLVTMNTHGMVQLKLPFWIPPLTVWFFLDIRVQG